MDVKVSELVSTEDNLSLYDLLKDICDTINKHFSVDEMSRNSSTEKIDWEDISNFIRNYSSEHDGYNIFPSKLSSYDDLLFLRDNILDAYGGKKPFIKRTCMECHRSYYIYISEKRWMERKGYPLPKRCVSCRKTKSRSYGFAYNPDWSIV